MVEANIDSPYFQVKLDALQGDLIDSLSHSPLTQTQKESILKIIYVKSTQYIEEVLEKDLAHINEIDSKVMILLYLLWGGVLVLSLGLVFILTGIMHNFKATQLGVYTVFLSLKEPTIRQIFEACKRLVNKVNLEANKVQDDDDLMNVRKELEEENEIEKIKQFKVTSTPEDRTFWIQMVLPLFLLILYALATMLVTTAQYRHFMHLKVSLDKFYEVVPLSSIEFMKVLYQQANARTLPIANDLHSALQAVEGNLRTFQEETGSPVDDFMKVLYGNVCQNAEVVPVNQKLSCETLGNGILSSGVSPALNYVV